MRGVNHGGALDRAIAQYGGAHEGWLDLSTGINPVAYPVPDLPDHLWSRLPDDGLLADCLAAARHYFDVPDDAAIVAAPGSQAIIQHLDTFFHEVETIVVGPTYGEYVNRLAPDGYVMHQVDALPADFSGARNIVACHPNNPDGRLLDREQVSVLLDSGERNRCRLVADEAFADTVPEMSLTGLTGGPGLVVMRSFGKFFGLAGLRLGFAIGCRYDMEALAFDLGPWAVSGPALHVGALALRDTDWIDTTRARLADDAERLRTLLHQCGLSVVGGTDLFVLADHQAASTIAEGLAARHILVRSFDYNSRWLRFGLPADAAAFRRLGDALAEIMESDQHLAAKG